MSGWFFFLTALARVTSPGGFSESAASAPADPFAVPEIAGPEISADPDTAIEVVAPVASADPDAPSPARLRVRADRVQFTSDQQVILVEGNVEVHDPPFVLLADALRVDFGARRIDALGRVRVVERNRLLACRQAEVQMATSIGWLRGARFEIRDQPVPIERARDLDALGHSWPGTLWLFGEAREVKRESNGALVLSDAMVTPCDCGDDPPSWKLAAAHVDVVTDHGAWAHWPVLYVSEIPVFALPVWYIPLSDRQSGLLAPRFVLRDGFWLLQPIYVTLGESADLTLSPGIVLTRGPRAELELRWAPWVGSDGFVQLATQWDEKFMGEAGGTRESPLVSRAADGERVYAERAALRLRHRESRGRSAAVVDLRLTTDRRVAGDFGDTLGARVEPYVRSAAQASLALDDNMLIGAHASAYQDLQQQRLLFFPTPGTTPYRAPALFWHLLPTGIGPLVVAGDADVVRLGLLGSGSASPLVSDSLHEAWRLALAPRLQLPWRLADVARAELGLGMRQALFAPDLGDARFAGALLVDSSVSSELARVYELGRDRWRHAVEPFLRYAGVPLLWSDSRGQRPVLDEVDRFAVTHQFLAGVRNRLHLRRAGGAILPVADVTLAQGLDLQGLRGAGSAEAAWQNASADTLIAARLSYMSLSARFLVAAQPVSGRVGALLSEVRLGFPNSLTVGASYDYIGTRPADLLYAANHELFGDTAIPVPSLPVADRLAVGISCTPWRNTRVGYSGELAILAEDRRQVFRRVLTHGGEVVYRSSCNCWEAGLRTRFWPDRPLPDVGLVLTVTGFGEQISIF
ncbi:MAG: LPS-assembly protein LptD [Deltaproteobacteria bacterium]|nr:LPS-assembly protein LptD [Deltaproteobacteria bacterium]